MIRTKDETRLNRQGFRCDDLEGEMRCGIDSEPGKVYRARAGRPRARIAVATQAQKAEEDWLRQCVKELGEAETDDPASTDAATDEATSATCDVMPKWALVTRVLHGAECKTEKAVVEITNQ